MDKPGNFIDVAGLIGGGSSSRTLKVNRSLMREACRLRIVTGAVRAGASAPKSSEDFEYGRGVAYRSRYRGLNSYATEDRGADNICGGRETSESPNRFIATNGDGWIAYPFA